MDQASKKLATGRFDAVVKPHFDALYRVAMRLTRSRPDAEDLVQEVCLRALPELHRLEAVDYPRGWLLRVQYRIYVDSVRHRLRSPFTATTDAEMELAASGEPGPEELTDEFMKRRRLARIWAGLDRKQRALLALHAEGYTLAELQAISGLSKNAVGVRLHRARARLARLMTNDSAPNLQLARMEK